MSTKKCVLCGKDIEGSLYGIELTLCCKECCENVGDSDVKRVCSDVRAMSEFGCRRRDLKELSCLRVINPHSRRRSWLQFYLTAEVKHLGETVKLWKEQEKKTKRPYEESQCIAKRQRLETTHRVLVHEIRPILRPFVLGDYTQSFRSKILLRDVKQRYSVRDRAFELIDSCKAHPISALAFCIDHPSGTVETYLELKESMRKVFSMEGNRIMQMLTPGDRQRLKGTPLEDVVSQFENRDTKTILFRKLKERVGTATAEEIMSHEACQQRINRGGEETQVAEKLVAFWKCKDNIDQRSRELHDVLHERHVRLPTIPGIFVQYIVGGIDVDLEEAVGITEIYSDLFFMDSTDSGNYTDICVSEFRRCFIDEQMTLDDSLVMAMKKFPTKREKPFIPLWLLFNAAMNEKE